MNIEDLVILHKVYQIALMSHLDSYKPGKTQFEQRRFKEAAAKLFAEIVDLTEQIEQALKERK